MDDKFKVETQIQTGISNISASQSAVQEIPQPKHHSFVYTLVILFLLFTLSGLLFFYSKQPKVENTEVSSMAVVQDDPLKDWKTYRNERFGFEIKYPPNWYTDACNWDSGFSLGFGENRTLFLCGTDAPGSSLISVTVVRKMTTLEEFLRESSYSHIKNITITNGFLDKIPAIRVESVFDKEPEGGWFGDPVPLGTKIMRFISYYDGVVYNFGYHEENSNEFNRMISTFKFINKKNDENSLVRIYSHDGRICTKGGDCGSTVVVALDGKIQIDNRSVGTIEDSDLNNLTYEIDSAKYNVIIEKELTGTCTSAYESTRIEYTFFTNSGEYIIESCDIQIDSKNWNLFIVLNDILKNIIY